MIRPRQASDTAEIHALYTESVPQLTHEHVLVEDGRIVGHGGIRMVPEAVLTLAKGHPAARMHWLRQFQEVLLGFVHQTGHTRVIALVAPKIERGFLRRLKSLGWEEGYQTSIFLTEGEDGSEQWRD